MIRPVDVSPANSISSNQISDLTIEINGKGVVNDAIKRPFFLFRILAGILP
jgi:flagellar basal body L-ring protein FlgH